MGSQVIKVLRQGVWGSLTGGWYYDPRHSKFTNVFHLYAWLVLLCLPFTFYLAFEPSWAVVGSYLVTIFTIFAALKLTNFRLHSMFDDGEIVNRKEVRPDGTTVDVTDQIVEEDNANAPSGSGIQDQPTVADAFPVAGSGDASQSRQDENTTVTTDITNPIEHSHLNKADVTVSVVQNRDLEVDVHIDSENVTQKSPPKDVNKTDDKEFPDGRKKVKRRKKKVKIFEEPSLSPAKPVNVDRCDSLSSASSDDTDDGPTSSTGSTSSTEPNTDDIGSSEEAEGDVKKSKTFHPSSRPIQRRVGIRGHTKHPWYHKPRDTYKLSFDDQDVENHKDSSNSSGPGDEIEKEAENGKFESVRGKGSTDLRPTRSLSRRKRVSGERSMVSPHRKQAAVDRSSSDTSSNLEERQKHSKGQSEDRRRDKSPLPGNLEGDHEKEIPTSDQELLARDPVWRARRSRRYSSDHRLFSRRRRYEISERPNRMALSDRDAGRRRYMSTMPGRRQSPIRATQSSLQKLWSLWQRDPVPSWTRDQEPPSPGQVSPGEVPRFKLEMENSEPSDLKDKKDVSTSIPSNLPQTKVTSGELTDVFPLDNDTFLPSNEESKRTSGKGTDTLGFVRHISETSSHNSNPHCNEISLSASKAGGDNQLSSSPAPKLSIQTHSAERKRKKRKRVASNPSEGTDKHFSDPFGTKASNVLSYDPGLPNRVDPLDVPAPRLLPRQESEDVYDSEEDMKKFIHNILGASDAWQGQDNSAESPSTSKAESNIPDPETGIKQTQTKQLKRKLSTEVILNNRDEATIGSSGLALVPSLVTTSEPRLTRRPRHSFPTIATAPTEDQSASTTQYRGRMRLASAPQGGSGGSRRVRHPAGNTKLLEHSRLTSNTSEEGGAAVTTTLQQLSANSLTSTTELLANTHDDAIPYEVIAKLEEAQENSGIHIATEHNDTTEGAIHAFQDERGNWLTYTFGEGSQGVATSLGNNPSGRRSGRARARTMSSWQSGDTTDSAKSPPASRRERSSRRIEIPSMSRRFHFRGNFLEGSDGSGSFYEADSPDMSPLDFILNSGVPNINRPVTPRVKLYYKFKFFPCKSVILQYDRLALLDLLDRNRHVIENLFAILMVLLVAFLGFLLLWRGFFLDVWPLWFCAVIATCQYSLIRSVQPDSASPMHGHNRIIGYSRPVYFCMTAILILVFDHIGKSSTLVPSSYMYGNMYFTQASCLLARDVLIVLIMLLPFIFLLGLLPQINTFVTYTAEQIDVHMFGGTACTGLVASLYSLTRSIVTCCCLVGFCYGGMKTKEKSQHILFSIFCGLLISFSYHLSRQTSDPVHLWRIIKSRFFSDVPKNESSNAETGQNRQNESKEENPDELSSIYIQRTLTERLQSDLIVCPLIAVFMFAIHCSTAFKVLQPSLSYILYILAGIVGLLTHYILPQLRKQLPWLLFSSPLLKTKEYHLFEVQEEAQCMWFEKAYIWLCFGERNILYPIIILNELTRDAPAVVNVYGLVWGSIILTFVGLKLVRSSYCVTLLQYAILAFSALFTHYDARNLEDTTLITYFLFSIFFVKLQELLLKLQFILVYIAPWQITWGSAFHAFAQPFSVPHSGMLLLHTVVSSLLHAPLAPFLGSAVFLTSYIRPIKFWERNYNTKRVDNSNTRLAAQIDRGPASDDNNLNSIFYEHLTLSLQKSLCGDVAMGRWGNVYPGDCFIMASDYLNALVHVIQRGNGALTFQLRGLEFSGTYCQQREVEAIMEGVDDNYGLCCFRPGRVKNMLSVNSAFNQRWLAWQVQATKYVLDGYSITDNSATSMLGVYDLRKILITYMVKSVIYFLTSHKSLEKWLSEEAIVEAMTACEAPDFADIDTNFSVTIHDDYDIYLSGISRNKFHQVYGDWIQHCSSRRNKPIESGKESKLVSLCFLISVLSRRALGTASSHLTANHVVLESFLYGLHSLFKGDFRITSSKDEWVFADMDLLHHVVVPGVRMSLKLHQDHFQNSDEEEDLVALYDTITEYIKDMVITHEADPEWRKAVLSNRNSLLALRHHAGDAVDSYFVITLKRRSLGFRVVRVNRECVKGLWAGQQQELVFLRNRNPERGSIQNAKQVLRNMINSSCDQPIGYPIYVSPVTTSFSNTHSQYEKIVGGSLTIHSIRRSLSRLWGCLLQSCGGGCNSGGSAGVVSGADVTRYRHSMSHSIPAPPPSGRNSIIAGSQTSSNQSNVGPISPAPSGNFSEQITINRMIRNSTQQGQRTLSSETRRHTRSNTEDYGSSSSITGGRSSVRWRTGPDMKSLSSRHPSGAGSMEMSPMNNKLIVPPTLSVKSSKHSRKEGSDSLTMSDTVVFKYSRSSLPADEVASRGSQTSGSGSSRKIEKSTSGITAASSSSSSINKGDFFTGTYGQLAPLAKATRKSSRDSESDVRSSVLEPKTHDTVNQAKEEQTTGKEIVAITDPTRVFETLDMHRRNELVKWPNEEWRKRGGREKWKNWRPKKGTVGEIVFRWHPFHRSADQRAHIGEVIVLLQVENPSNDKKPFYVPIPESCVTPLKSTDVIRSETTQF